MKHAAFPDGYTRDDLLDWYRRNRARSRELFDLIVPEAYYDRPIALRNPIVFYEGHLPAFSVNTLLKLTHGRAGVDERLETLFARGIDPESEDAVKDPVDVWPSRADIHAYAKAADALVLDALATVPIGEAVFTILEHEQMHHETLLYMFHNLPYDRKREGGGQRAEGRGGVTSAVRPPPSVLSRIPAGQATLGTPEGTFGWDNEFPAHTVHVDAFEIDAHPVTNGEYREYIEATGAKPPHFWQGDQWRGMFALEPMPLHAPVYVMYDEAVAYANWKGMRLPTEAEYLRAELPVGHGWEWTSTVFAPFEGFRPMPSYREYSADFFDGAHYVLKGASPATAPELIRPGFRNWFRPNYPYVYAVFRCARDVH